MAPRVKSLAKPVHSPIKAQGKIHRRSSTREKVWCDVFKLLVAPCIKFIGWKQINDPSQYAPTEHVHRFYTVDKATGDFVGRSTENCSHYHVVEIEKDKDGSAVLDEKGHFKLKVGPAVHKYAKRDKETGMTYKMVGPPFLYKEMRDGQLVEVFDTHTHEAVYEKSNPMAMNSLGEGNAALAAALSAFEAPPPTPAGLQIG